MHDLEIVHGDLKGVCCNLSQTYIVTFLMFLQTNILVSDDQRALIADFGTSSIAGAPSTGGSSRWMAPEVLLHLVDDEIGAASKPWDIWSFACLCYEVRTFEPTPCDPSLTAPKGFDGKTSLLPIL